MAAPYAPRRITRQPDRQVNGAWLRLCRIDLDATPAACLAAGLQDGMP